MRTAAAAGDEETVQESDCMELSELKKKNSDIDPVWTSRILILQ